jgi:hypothetical protein
MASSSKTVRGNVRDIILKVWQFCDDEKGQNEMIIYIDNGIQRPVAMTVEHLFSVLPSCIYITTQVISYFF